MGEAAKEEQEGVGMRVSGKRDKNGKKEYEMNGQDEISQNGKKKYVKKG